MDISKGEGQRHLAHHRCDDWLSGQCHYRCLEIPESGRGCESLCRLGIRLVLKGIRRRDDSLCSPDVHPAAFGLSAGKTHEHPAVRRPLCV